jgi:hypothetical protein
VERPVTPRIDGASEAAVVPRAAKSYGETSSRPSSFSFDRSVSTTRFWSAGGASVRAKVKDVLKDPARAHLDREADRVSSVVERCADAPQSQEGSGPDGAVESPSAAAPGSRRLSARGAQPPRRSTAADSARPTGSP